MREVLFRGKRLDNGEWVEGYVMIHDHDKATIFRQNQGDGSLEGFEVVPETVCQYTGMTDKNGSKVWENDIIQMFYRDGETNVGTIRYTDECVRFQYYEGNIIGYGIDITCDMEVIGNIFDNPELLKDGGGDE